MTAATKKWHMLKGAHGNDSGKNNVHFHQKQTQQNPATFLLPPKEENKGKKAL